MEATYKLSSYVIISEPINATGSCILYSTRSGRELAVSRAVLTSLQQGTFGEMPETINQQLIETQMLVPESMDELGAIVAENQSHIDQSVMLYEVIQPSAMCQLGCYYCGQTHTKDYLTSEAEEKILTRIRLKASAGNFRELFIGWFGAEPLMGLRQIRRMTPQLKAIAAEFGLAYSAKLVTNGLSLKPAIYEELALQLGVRHIEVTLDGIGEYHDKHRYMKDGGASFDVIMGNLSAILHYPDLTTFNCPISIRCNVDRANVAGVSPLIRLLVEKGLHRKIATFYTMGVYSWGNDAHKQSLTKEEFAQRELGWKAEMLMLGYSRIPLLPHRKKQVCMTVSKHTDVYDANGNIFDCTETSYVPLYANSTHQIGHINADYQNLNLQRSYLQNWNNTLLTDRFPCHSCPMLPVCGGACPKSWHEDMRACPTAKFTIRENLLMKYYLLKRVNGQHDKANELLSMYANKAWIKYLDTPQGNSIDQVASVA